MTRDDILRVVYESLGAIAPEADLASVAKDADLREELDLDSMDFLKFVGALHTRLGVDIPEAEYSRLFTLSGAEAYLFERTRAGTRAHGA